MRHVKTFLATVAIIKSRDRCRRTDFALIKIAQAVQQQTLGNGKWSSVRNGEQKRKNSEFGKTIDTKNNDGTVATSEQCDVVVRQYSTGRMAPRQKTIGNDND